MSARTGRVFGTALAALILTAAAEPESRLEQYQRLRTESVAASQAGDLATAEARMEAAHDLFPTSPGTLIRLSLIEIAAGKRQEALDHLWDYVHLGLSWDFSEPRFSVLAEVPDPKIRANFIALASVSGANKVAYMTGAQPVVTLPDPGEVYEGLARQGKGWLISSVSKRSITRYDPAGGFTPFFTPDNETGGLFGMAADPEHNVLWVAESRGPGIPGSTGQARTGLLKLNLKTGNLIARFFVADDGGKHQIGDILLGPDGTVYASDSLGSTIWRLAPGSPKMERIATSREIASAQGMTLCPDGKALVVADYSSGLHRIDLADGGDELIGGVKAALQGTDGLLALPGGDIIGIQNGVTPQRVLRLTLSAGCRSVTAIKVLAAGGRLDDASLGALGEGDVVVVGQSGWAYRDGDGKLADGEHDPARLLTIPLT